MTPPSQLCPSNSSFQRSGAAVASSNVCAQMHQLITTIHIASKIRHCTSIGEPNPTRPHQQWRSDVRDFRRDKSGNWGGRLATSACNAETERVTAAALPTYLFTIVRRSTVSAQLQRVRWTIDSERDAPEVCNGRLRCWKPTSTLSFRAARAESAVLYIFLYFEPAWFFHVYSWKKQLRWERELNALYWRKINLWGPLDLLEVGRKAKLRKKWRERCNRKTLACAPFHQSTRRQSLFSWCDDDWDAERASCEADVVKIPCRGTWNDFTQKLARSQSPRAAAALGFCLCNYLGQFVPTDCIIRYSSQLSATRRQHARKKDAFLNTRAPIYIYDVWSNAESGLD